MAQGDEQQDYGERGFSFLRLDERPAKPRSRGITEIRGPCPPGTGREDM